MFYPPRGLPIRPTTDRSKESLFNILDNRFDFTECDILDLFSGSGTISLEFASRDVRHALALDKHPGCVNFLKEMAEKLHYEQIHARRGDVMQYIKTTEEKYDIIFCDAPYAWKMYEPMIRIILDRNLLKDEGQLIVEHHVVTRLEKIPELIEQRAYGQNILSFFGNTKAAEK